MSDVNLTRKYKGYKLAYQEIIDKLLKDGICHLTMEDLWIEETDLPPLEEVKFEFLPIEEWK